MKLAEIFCDNMVLEANKPVWLFGTGVGRIRVELCGELYEDDVGDAESGTWRFRLPAHPYGGTYDMTLTLDGESRVIRGIAFGEVILCSGQSNMQFNLYEEEGVPPVRTDEKIRCYMSVDSQYGGREPYTSWHILREGEVDDWSALGLHIAEHYRRERDVYVGIVGAYHGATSIRSWMPECLLDRDVFVPLDERHRDHVVYAHVNGDSYMYNVNLSKVLPYTVGAAVWYQGESNTTVGEAAVYTEMLRRFISFIRREVEAEVPFVVVEICDYDQRDDEGWHAIQRCQREVSGVIGGVSVVASSDVCEHGVIHPRNKNPLACRIAAALLAKNG